MLNIFHEELVCLSCIRFVFLQINVLFNPLTPGPYYIRFFQFVIYLNG